MTVAEKILVVVSSNRDTHPGLERIKRLTSEAGKAIDLEVIIQVMANLEYVERELHQTTITRDFDWIHTFKSDIDELGIKNRLLVSWSSDWAQSLVDAVEEYGITLAFVPFYGTLRASMLSDERWKFLRKTRVPVMLAVDSDDASRGKILASVKSQDPQYDSRNAAVLAMTQRTAQIFGSEIHVVNAYSDSMDFPDRGQLAKAAGIDADRVHIKVGDPEDVIRDVATEQGIDLVLIASQRRQGFKGRLRGNTVEKIVGKLDCDILMI
ncbi:MAG: hypothetical protein AseanaTS_05670 [Candidatus Pelagadaptatus aseana]|uniref:universal stress protein n=1 Tax=Candidatus Pelagadaptatus aseana TaxID=3120508 RepID=UPI0039B2A580